MRGLSSLLTVFMPSLRREMEPARPRYLTRTASTACSSAGGVEVGEGLGAEVLEGFFHWEEWEECGGLWDIDGTLMRAYKWKNGDRRVCPRLTVFRGILLRGSVPLSLGGFGGFSSRRSCPSAP